LALVAAALAARAGASPAPVFGPQSYTRATGAPVTVTSNFTVTSPSNPYLLHVDNGGSHGELARVSSATVTLNGVEILKPGDFNQNVATLDRQVTLTAGQNQLQIRISSAPGSGFTLQITGNASDSTPPAVAITAPAADSFLASATPTITATYSDAGSGVDPASVRLVLDGVDRTAQAQVTATGLTFTPAAGLAEGHHDVQVTVKDRAGNPAQAVEGFTTDTVAPAVAVTAPAAGGLVNTVAVPVDGTVSDASGAVTVRVNNVDATVSGGQFQSTLFLNEGANQILVTATDAAGNQGTATSTVRLDTRPPDLTLDAPVPGQLVNSGSVQVAGRATDANGIADVTVNGAPVALDSAGGFTTQVPVGEGAVAIAVRAHDRAGNAADLSAQVVGFTLPAVTVDSPADLSFLAATTVDVTGTVADPSAVVAVNGVPAVVTGNRFTAREVPLIEGSNVLTASAILPNGHANTASVNVVRDLTPPHVTIDVPAPGSTLFAPTVTVSGLVNDIVPGTVNAAEATVTINGRPATVANRSYVVDGIALSPGDNTLTAVATDRSGNVAQTTVTVHLAAPTVPHLTIASGDRQQAVIGSALPQPLVVLLVDGAGAPLAGKAVVWSVRGGDGTLDGGKREVAVTTDAAGRASAHFTLGHRAGAATQTVEVSAAGLAIPVLFTAAALPGPPDLIVVDSGDQQIGTAGQALPRPLVAAVIDAGFNRRQGVGVKFTVVAGAGRFANGLPEVTVTTDSDGRAIAPFVLDPSEGVANNTVEAAIEGLDNGPVASFVATGLTAGSPAATSISGVVLDNSNQPIEGVTLRILNSALTAQTDARGRFRIAGAPVGSVTLIADGSTANRPGSWPDLEFVLTTVPGRDNTINMPIYLLPIDVAHGVPVDETRGGTVRLAELPGFALEIAPGSVTFPGGSKSGVVSVTLVHTDKVPMIPNFGQQPRFIVTIQPPGARFDPPARLTMPNVDALAPGSVTEFYSFDHDLGHFVSIGPATVSDNGLVVTSNRGVGIVKGGWHCGGNPSTSGTAHSCPDCKKCVNSNCQVDPAKESRSCDDHNECTANDKCTGGTCRGTKIRVTITKAPTVVCVDNDKPAAATIEPSDRPIFWRVLNNTLSVAGNDTTASVHGVARGTGTLVAQDAQTDCSKDQRSVQVITKDQDFNGMGEKTMCVLGSLGGEAISAEIAAACFRAGRRGRQIQDWEKTAFPDPRCRVEGGASDAARHARWSCELYSDPLTRDFAEDILRRHENRPDDPCISHEQDMNNNEVGHSNASAGKDCTASALQDLAAGRLQVNSPPPPGVSCP
jgi:hypothetical protein